MNIKGEKSILGQDIMTPEQFIEDICDRIKGILGKIQNFEDNKVQLSVLFGFLNGLTQRLNRVCER